MTHCCLETLDLCIGYHNRSRKKPVASGLNLRLHAKELTCLIGPNGAGKSTLLRTLCGLQKAISGGILIEGEPVGKIEPVELAKQVSIVLTGQLHPGDLRVRQIVEMGRLPYTDWLGTLSEEDHRVVNEALLAINALHLAERSFGEISDGERQKVMIARALAQETNIIFLDEPTAFLDWANRVELLVTLRNLARDSGKTILISSHDLELVLQIADNLWIMGHDGGVLAGKCEEMIGQGALERVFRNQYGQFEPARGRFKILS